MKKTSRYYRIFFFFFFFCCILTLITQTRELHPFEVPWETRKEKHTHTHTKEWVSSEESRRSLSLSLSLELSCISRSVAQFVVVVPYKRERRCAQRETSADGLFLPGAAEGRGRRVDSWNEGWKGGIGVLKWGVKWVGPGHWAGEMRGRMDFQFE